MQRTMQDRPYLLHTLVVVAISLEALAVAKWIPSLWDAWIKPDLLDGRRDFYAALIGASALLSGCSGVVSIYGLQSSGRHFVRFKVRAGAPLKRNWTAIVSAAILAMFASMTAFVVDSVWSPPVAVYLTQLAILFLIENSIRSIWLLRKLVDVTTAEHQQTYSDQEF